MADTAQLPITKMTLYKHGVGFYVRRGQVQAETVSLTFRTEDMNDVLKSLTAIASGAQVLGVDYQTPEDKASLLARSPIRLSDHASLRDLLAGLRGRRVRVTTAADILAGTVIGMDLPGEREPLAAALLSLFITPGGADDGSAAREVRPVRLGDIRAVRLEDEAAASDLEYILETSLAEEDKRALTVRLSAPGDLMVSYIAPSPVWRVSYRLIVDADASSSLIQGWSLFDNTLDEDLENVAVTFVAGMPVSFVYDLYTPFTPERPVVKEEARRVAAPVEFAEALPATPPAAAPRMKPALMADTARLAAAVPALPPGASQFEASTTVAATGQAQGEFFSYVVANPVTVRRGRSALAPILQARVAGRKERIYNGRKHPRRPTITMRLRNETGLTLERGPLTIIEAGEYAGEAMLPFTAAGGEMFVAYAVDLSVTVTETPESQRVLAGINLREGLLVIQEWDVQATTYRVENHGDAATSVTVEHPRLAGYEQFDAPEPAESTAEHHRYVVEVAAHASATFSARQRRMLSRREDVQRQSLDQLARWLRERVLDQATFDRLAGILALYDRLRQHEAAAARNEAARQEILGEQKVIQGHLVSLRDTGDEGQLRSRYVRTLQEMEDRLARLREDDARLAQAGEQTAQEIEAALKML